jgi:hypothetical protein
VFAFYIMYGPKAKSTKMSNRASPHQPFANPNHKSKGGDDDSDDDDEFSSSHVVPKNSHSSKPQPTSAVRYQDDEDEDDENGEFSHTVDLLWRVYDSDSDGVDCARKSASPSLTPATRPTNVASRAIESANISASKLGQQHGNNGTAFNSNTTKSKPIREAVQNDDQRLSPQQPSARIRESEKRKPRKSGQSIKPQDDEDGDDAFEGRIKSVASHNDQRTGGSTLLANTATSPRLTMPNSKPAQMIVGGMLSPRSKNILMVASSTAQATQDDLANLVNDLVEDRRQLLAAITGKVRNEMQQLFHATHSKESSARRLVAIAIAIAMHGHGMLC